MPELSTDCVDPRWEQGSILDLSQLPATDVEPPFEAGTLPIVISQSCDVIHDSFDEEPKVDLLLARPIEVVEGNFTDGKNPRTFDFVRKVGLSDEAYRCFIREKMQSDRRILLGKLPIDRIDDDIILALKRWVGKRYTRAALPTKFNDRARPCIDTIKAILKRNSEITGIYLSLSSDEELPDGSPYGLILTTTVLPKTKADENAFDRVIRATSKISEALNACNGLEIMEATPKSEEYVTLYDLRDMDLWDYDYLSVRAGSILPSEP